MQFKNYELHILEDRCDAVSFGSGKENLVIVPGLGDGITTVRGKALLGNLLYHKYSRKYRVTFISRKNNLEADASTETMARDLYYAMQALGIQKAHVLGVSMGGMIAQYLAANYPQSVDKLILAVTAPAAGELIQENAGRWIGFAEMGSFLGLMIDISEKAHTEKYLKRLRPLYPYLGSAARKMDIRRFCIQARACSAHDASERLDKITAPTLIIGGRKDRTIGEEASHQLHRLIPGSQLKIFPDGTHALYQEDPEFHRTVLDFLEKQETSL